MHCVHVALRVGAVRIAESLVLR